MSTFVYLSSIAFLLFMGLVGYLVSRRFNVPHSLILVFIGFCLRYIEESAPFFLIPEGFSSTIIMAAYILIVFDIFSRYDFSMPTSLHTAVRSFKILALFIGFPLVALICFFLFGFESLVIAGIFAALALPSSRMFICQFRPKKNILAQMLEIESIRLTAFALIIAAGLASFYGIEYSMDGVRSFGMSIIIGFGTGIVCGLLFIHLMRSVSSRQVSQLGLITAIVITYALTEALGGIAIFGVMTLAFLFGSVRIQQKPFLHEFSSLAAEFIEMTVFVLLGFMIAFDPALVWRSFLVFFAVALVRFAMITLTANHLMSAKERIFLALTQPKDVAVGAALLMLLITPPFTGMTDLFGGMLQVILISVAISYGASMAEKKFYDKDIRTPRSEM